MNCALSEYYMKHLIFKEETWWISPVFTRETSAFMCDSATQIKKKKFDVRDYQTAIWLRDIRVTE